MIQKIFLILFLGIPFHILGQCCSGGVPINTNVGLPQSVKGTIQTNLSFDWNQLKTLKSGPQNLKDDTRERITQTLFVEIGYSVNDRFSIDFFIPNIKQKRTIKGSFGTDRTESNGIGDIVVLPKYEFLKNLVIGVGIKFPTGPSNETSNGLVLNADLQPGSGSTDQLLYLSYENTFAGRPSLTYYTQANSILKGENKSYLVNSTYKFGNETNIIIGLSDRVLIKKLILDPFIKIHFRSVKSDEFDSSKFPNSGGQFLMLSKGISLALSQNIYWQTSTTIPIYTNVIGTQLAPTLRIQTGISFKLQTKKAEL